MKAIKAILRILCIILSLGAFGIGGYSLYMELNNVEFNILDPMFLVFLAAYGAAFILSLHVVIGLMRLIAVKLPNLQNKWLYFILIFILAIPTAPIFLLVALVRHIIGLVRILTNSEAMAQEAEEFRNNERVKTYIRSSREAIDKITGDDRSDIILDNGDEILTLRQVALIQYRGMQYALLSPRGGAHAGTVLAFVIDKYLDTGEDALILVSDRETYDAVYNVYQGLLNKSKG